MFTSLTLTKLCTANLDKLSFLAIPTKEDSEEPSSVASERLSDWSLVVVDVLKFTEMQFAPQAK